MTSPLRIFCFEIASNASSSELNTFAIPSNLVLCSPAIFITAPSGAREPFRIFNVPSGCRGFSQVYTTGSELFVVIPSRFCFIVFPVTVIVFPFNNPFLSKLFSMTGTPPTLSKSTITYIPPGLVSAK